MEPVNTTPFSPAWFVTKLDPRAFSIIVLVKGTFRLLPDSVMETAEDQQAPTGDLHLEDDPLRPLVYGSDFAPYKPSADVVLSARAWAPGGIAAPMAEASFRVGRLAKSLRVYGERYWLGRNETSAPKPYLSYPITWEGAFGGQGFAPNPLGRGLAEVEINGMSIRPAPNVELVTQPQNKRAEKVRPAGFGPIPSTWPPRSEKAGKIDKNYLKERWPYYPESFDWAHFNLAPEDQRLEDYLKGDEEVVFRNLHPKYAEFRTKLPGLRLRCFLDERTRARQQLREIPLKLDTFWAEPDAELGILVWRGNAVVRTEKLLEVTHLLIAAEKLAVAPAPVSAFEPVLLGGVIAGESEEEADEAGEEEQEEEAADDEEDAGEGPGAGGEGGATGEGAQPGETVGGRGEQPGTTEEEPEPGGAGVVESGEPDLTEALTLEQVAQMIAARASFKGRDLSGLNLSGFDLAGLDLSEGILEGATLERANLKGTNLAGALLFQANLARAQCAGANFAECDLTFAWLDEANLEGAALVGADLTGASLRRAILRRVNAAESVFCEADLSDAVFEQAKLNSADLCDARLHRTNFREADLSEVALEGAWGQDVLAEKAHFRKLRAASSRLPGANFSNGSGEESVWELSELGGANFSGAVLRSAEFSGSFLGDATFDAAEMRDARLVETRLPRARLRRANLFGALLEKADVSEADISGSNLYEATLTDASLQGTNFESANLRRVRGRKE